MAEQEREHGHASSQVEAQVRHDTDPTPGRSSLSATLDAPTQPLTSALIQRKAERDGNGVAEGADAAITTASSSSGMSLPAPIQRKFEASLGTDLSSVQLHTGGASASAAQAVGAKAYTVGQDIHFGGGHYDPSSAAGEHLLAHEVAHTVQQRGGTPARQNKLEVSAPGDASEHEADRAADAMVAGAPATISGFAGVQRQVFRDAHANPNGGGDDTPQFEPKASFDIGEVKLPEDFVVLKYVKVSQSIKGKGSVELAKPDGKGGAQSASTTGGTSLSNTAAGAKFEHGIAQQHFSKAVAGVKIDGAVKEKLAFQITSDQLKAQVGLETRLSWAELPWLKGAVDGTLNFLDVKWDELKKDPDKVKVASAELAGGVSGEGSGTIPELGGRLAKTSLTLQYVVNASPNWAKIGLEAAKEIAKEGATDAGTEAATTTTAGAATAETGLGGAAADAAVVGDAVVIDSAAVASAAATIIFPLGAAALIAAGFVQTEKNTAASRAAFAMGLKLRREAKDYVHAYVSTLFGHERSGRGALDANVKIAEYMAATHKNRADACAELERRNNYATLTAEIMSKFRDSVYDKGVAEFEAKFANQFGYLEKLGPTWGMRNVFRKDFRLILYSDD